MKRLRIQTLQEQRQIRNHEHQEDTDDTMIDPLERWREVVAPSGPKELPRLRVLADLEPVADRAQGRRERDDKEDRAWKTNGLRNAPRSSAS